MTEPWCKIVAFYDDFLPDEPSVQAVGDVARHINHGRLRSGLFAWTSHMDLFITQMPVSYPYDGPRLGISPRFDGTVEFRYIDTWDEKKQWHRTVDGSDAIQRLHGFLDQLTWFPRRSRIEDPSSES